MLLVAGVAIGLSFRGVVDEVRSSGSRSAGRVLSISGKGFDAQGKAKQQRLQGHHVAFHAVAP